MPSRPLARPGMAGRRRAMQAKATGAQPDPSLAYLGTVFSEGKKACWLAPQGGSEAAKRVVLFMHGFSQGPNAYYKLLREVADGSDALVVAPVPPLIWYDPRKQQAAMVEFALHFHKKLYSRDLTGLPLADSTVSHNIALLGHSVGAGLGSHVAAAAAAKGQPFKAVMFMAPQTKLIVPEFSAKEAIEHWPSNQTKSTKFALQYGLKDTLLAPPKLSTNLLGEINKKKLPITDQNVHVFDLGTHVGFQDQVVLATDSLVPDVLPWLNPLLLALVTIGFPFVAEHLWWLLVGRKPPADEQQLKGAPAASTSSSTLMETAGGAVFVPSADFALLLQQAPRQELQPHKAEQQKEVPPDGVGPNEEVKFAPAEASTRAYNGLLLVFVVLLIYLSWSTLQSLTAGGVSCLSIRRLIGTGLVGYCVYQGWSNLQLLSYVNEIQRPQSRAHAKSFISSI